MTEPQIYKYRGADVLIVLGVISAIVIILVALFTSLLSVLCVLLKVLLTGWAYFLFRKIPSINVSPEAVATGVGALLLLTAGMHLLCRRFFTRHFDEVGTARNWRFRWTISLVGIIILVFTAGISAVGLAHQTLWLLTSDEPRLRDRRGGDGRAKSANNLKQITIGFWNYHDAHGAVPLPATFDSNGRQLHGWETYLLPYLEQNALFQQIDLTKPWNHSANRSAFSKNVRTYQSPYVYPTIGADGYAITSYSLNIHAVSPSGNAKIDEIMEGRGTSNFLLIGDAAENYPAWGKPMNVRDPNLGLQRSPDGFGGPRKGITMFGMADGSVRTFRSDVDPEFLEMLAHPDDR